MPATTPAGPTTQPTTPVERPRLVSVRWSIRPFSQVRYVPPWNRIELTVNGLHHGNRVGEDDVLLDTTNAYDVSPEIADEILQLIAMYADGMPRDTYLGGYLHAPHEQIVLEYADGSWVRILNGLSLFEFRLSERGPSSRAYQETLRPGKAVGPMRRVMNVDLAVERLGTTRREYLTRSDLLDIGDMTANEWQHARMVWFEVTHTLQRAVLEAQWEKVPVEKSEKRTELEDPGF